MTDTKEVAVSVPYVTTTLVEESDERLAAVEEAKRTGEPFRSTASRGSSVVPTPVAAWIADEKGAQNTYVTDDGRTFAAHLESWHEKMNSRNAPEIIEKTNAEKAAEHEAYSADFERARQAEEERVRLAIKDGFDVSLAVQQANLERAAAHEAISAEYERVRQAANDDAKSALDVSNESTDLLNEMSTDNLTRADIVTALMDVNHVPDAMETPAEEALKLKDAIISTEESYRAHTAEPEETLAQDHPAVPILESMSSPEELDDETQAAQVAAGRIVEPENEDAAAEQFAAVRDLDDNDPFVVEQPADPNPEFSDPESEVDAPE